MREKRGGRGTEREGKEDRDERESLGGEGKGVGERGGREGKFRGARPPKRYFLEPRLLGTYVTLISTF